jgi:hypothetical protein
MRRHYPPWDLAVSAENVHAIQKLLHRCRCTALALSGPIP